MISHQTRSTLSRQILSSNITWLRLIWAWISSSMISKACALFIFLTATAPVTSLNSSTGARKFPRLNIPILSEARSSWHGTTETRCRVRRLISIRHSVVSFHCDIVASSTNLSMISNSQNLAPGQKFLISIIMEN